MRILTALLLVLFCCAIGDCGEPIPRPDANDDNERRIAAEVKELIRDLDADQLTVRRTAQKKLLKLGPRILPYLPPPELMSRLGVRRAVAELRIQLQRRKARASVEPSHVTVAGTRTLAELLSSIATQTGNRIAVDRLSEEIRNRHLSLTLEQEPFWAVMDRVVSDGRLGYRFAEMTDEILLSERKSTDKFSEVAVTHAGSFRVAVESVKLRARYHDVRVVMGIVAEPRLRPLFLKYAAADFAGTTDSGQNLLPKNPAAQLELPLGQGGCYTQLRIDLAESKSKINHFGLRGQFKVTVAAAEEKIRFTDLPKARNVARRRGGVTVKLVEMKSVETQGERHDITIHAAVTYDAGGPAFESHRTWIFHNKVFLETKTGERIDFPGGQRTTLSREGAVLVEYPFRNLKHPLSEYQFVYVAPTLIIDVPVKFEFKRIGL